jgi:hypothetical protein
MVTLTIAGEMRLAQTTPGHPFWIRQARGDTSGEDGDGDAGGWVLAGGVRPGDEVQTADGNWATVLAVSVKTQATPIYNFEVAENHTYYVGVVGVWVHNQSHDLTHTEVGQIQNVVNQAGRPLEVVGSAARGARRPDSDIDYLVPPSNHPYFNGLETQLPGLDPSHGIVPGVHNPYLGPAVRFEPGLTTPIYIPQKKP